MEAATEAAHPPGLNKDPDMEKHGAVTGVSEVHYHGGLKMMVGPQTPVF